MHCEKLGCLGRVQGGGACGVPPERAGPGLALQDLLFSPAHVPLVGRAPPPPPQGPVVGASGSARLGVRASLWYSGRGYPSNFACGRRMLLGEPLFGIRVHQGGRSGSAGLLRWVGGGGPAGRSLLLAPPGTQRESDRVLSLPWAGTHGPSFFSIGFHPEGEGSGRGADHVSSCSFVSGVRSSLRRRRVPRDAPKRRQAAAWLWR